MYKNGHELQVLQGGVKMKWQIKDMFHKLEFGDYEILFGKHEGDILSEVIKFDYAYLDWIIWKSSFEEHIKEFLAERIQEFQKHSS